MADKRWIDARWICDLMHDGFTLLKPGYYSIEEPQEAALTISHEDANKLVAYMKEQGYSRPEMPYDRAEDVKIINRLIDVLDKREG